MAHPGLCRWGSRAVLEYARDCQVASTTDLAARVAKGVQLTEARDSITNGWIAGSSLGKCPGLQHMGFDGRSGLGTSSGLCYAGGRDVAGCAETSSGRLHIGKTDVVTWCGR